MDNDDGRMLLASVAGFVLTLPLGWGLLAWIPWLREMAETGNRLTYTMVMVGLFWVLFGVFYAVMTLARFLGADAQRLYRDLRTVSRGLNERSVGGLLSVGSTISWTTQLSLTALIMVVVLMLDPTARGHLELRVLCVLVVMTSWGLLVISQALAYARAHAGTSREGIRFRGTPGPEFSDFLTLAVCISAMFGPADAQLSGRRVRRLLRNHVLVSFAFNSMVVATLATLLLVTD